MSIYDELVKNRSAKFIAGGAAQNSARGAQVSTSISTTITTNFDQYILPPNSVVYFGCVGKDESAEILQKANKEAGLTVKYRQDEQQPTGRCAVVITGHNRSMVTDLAAVKHLELW